MNNMNHKDFILWIANRLVFKYKEDPQILEVAKHIIEQQKEIKKSIVETQEFIDNIIKELQERKNIILQPLKERIILAQKNKYKNTFESIDIDNLLN
jgi:hypothetical protein